MRYLEDLMLLFFFEEATGIGKVEVYFLNHGEQSVVQQDIIGDCDDWICSDTLFIK